MDEDALVSRLEELERKVARGGPVGIEACRAELAAWRQREPDSEFRLVLPTPASQVAFLAMCRGYGLVPYRAARQRKTTVSVRVPSGFMHAILKPRLQAMLDAIDDATLEAVKRVMAKWSAKGGATNDSVCSECGQAESESGGALEADSISGGDSQGRLMIES